MYVCTKATWKSLIERYRISYKFNRILNTRSQKKHQTMSYKMIKKSDFLLYFKLFMLSITFPFNILRFFLFKVFPITSPATPYIVYIIRPILLIPLPCSFFINFFITLFLFLIIPSVSLPGAVPVFQSCNLTLILQLLTLYYLNLHL